VGVVKMPGEFVARDVAADHLDQLTGLAGRAGANGVAQGYFVAAHVEQLACHMGHRRRVDLALIGAAQYAGDIAAHLHAIGTCRLHQGGEARQALLDGTVDVSLGKACEAAANTATSLTPAAMAASSP